MNFLYSQLVRLFAITALAEGTYIPRPVNQAVLGGSKLMGGPEGGHNELYIPDYNNPVPGKTPFHVNERVHYYEKYINGSRNGEVRRSSCPAVNTLANRGFINRNGRNISYEEIAQASRDVYNFGDDNVSFSFSLSLSLSLSSSHQSLGKRTNKVEDHLGAPCHFCRASGRPN